MIRQHFANDPFIDEYIEGIAFDMGKDADFLYSSKQSVLHALQQFEELGKGKKREMRRWFTVFDGIKFHLDHWTIMLVGLMVEPVWRGVDPRSFVGKPREAMSSSFSYKTEVLATLLSHLLKVQCRSLVIIFQRLRDHHQEYTSGASSHAESVRFMLVWSDELRFKRTLLHRSLSDAMSPTNLRWIGFCEQVCFEADVVERDTTTLSDTQLALQSHVWLTLANLREIWMYGLQYLYC